MCVCVCLDLTEFRINYRWILCYHIDAMQRRKIIICWQKFQVPANVCIFNGQMRDHGINDIYYYTRRVGELVKHLHIKCVWSQHSFEFVRNER